MYSEQKQALAAELSFKHPAVRAVSGSAGSGKTALLADDPITAEDIARLGEGGLCLGCAECHWPNCGFGHC